MPISFNSCFFDLTPLKSARVHEASGMGRECFALSFASTVQKPIAWISDEFFTLNPFQLSEFLQPDQLIQMRCYQYDERLWVMEEALRSGTFGMVIANIDKPISLTTGRRLQLAAETGKTQGLCLIQKNMGSNTAETRWLCEPYFDPENSDSTHWQWYLKKNKTGTINAWKVQWNAQTRCINMVSRITDQPIDA